MAIEVVKSEGLKEGESTPNLIREQAFDTDNAVIMRSNAEESITSGWHHHGDREVFGFLLEGHARIEYGPDGEDAVELEAGDFFRVDPGTVHRDVNPVNEQQRAVTMFVGEGPVVVNVDGPGDA